VAPRSRSGGNSAAVPLAEFMAQLADEVARRAVAPSAAAPEKESDTVRTAQAVSGEAGRR
jgi:hypothetical protein